MDSDKELKNEEIIQSMAGEVLATSAQQSKDLGGAVIPAGGRPSRGYIKASMDAELQKFGKKEYQPLLGEDMDIQQGSVLYGLDFTEAQDRALHAVQKLLDDTDYLGNSQGERKVSTEFRWTGYLPTISFTPTQFYEACPGLEPAGDGRYHGAQVRTAMDALKSLMDSRYYISYSRQVYKGGKPVYKDGKKVYEAVRATGPLLYQVGESFSGLTEEELEAETASGGLPDTRRTKISITPSPILVMGIREGWYLLKPVNLHDEIKALYPGKKYPREVSLFLEWLITLNKKEMGVSREGLIIKLRMDYLKRNRKQALIDKRIGEALEVAKKLEYLLDYEIQPTGMIDLSLNPERCKRVGGKKKLSQSNKEAG